MFIGSTRLIYFMDVIVCFTIIRHYYTFSPSKSPLGNFSIFQFESQNNFDINFCYLQKIENHKLEWKVEAKTVTRNSGYVPPSKSEKKV